MKKKSSFNYDLGFFFLIAVIAVSLSAFVREMNTVLSGINDDYQAAQVLLSTTNTPRYPDDVSALGACSNKSVREHLDCVKSDFNGDGYVNFGDLAVLKASLKYDLNNDGVLTFTNDVSDLVVLKDCFLDSVRNKPSCAGADLDKDGYINFSDLQRLRSAFTYDLNNDKRVGGTATDGDLAVFKTCFGLAASSTAGCLLADFNKDRTINFLDLQLFQNATTNTDYDIDRNGAIEATPKGSDLSYFKICIFENPNTEASCKKADFNSDNFVNFVDLSLLKSATLYDLSGDGKVSYGDGKNVQNTPTPVLSPDFFTLPDYVLFNSCLTKPANTPDLCKKADFNNDGVVGQPDYTLFLSGIRYDLNGDNKVEWLSTGADYVLFNSCLTKPANTSDLCKKADFNNDGVVGQPDYTLFLSVARYDLNGDKKANYDITSNVSNVDLKVNNSDGPVTVTSGSFVTANWLAHQVLSCIRTGKGGGPVGWSSNDPSVIGGASFQVKSNAVLEVQCVTKDGQTVSDTVVVNVTAPSSPSAPTPTPTPTVPSRPSGK